MLKTIASFLYTPTPQMEISYNQVVGIITDTEKASRVAVLIEYLFTKTINSMYTQPSKESIIVEIQHPNTQYRKLPGYNTLFCVPSKVQFTLYKDGRIQFKDPAMAPYEQAGLMSYYVWHDVDILNDKVHIGSSHSVSRYNNSTEIPYSSILDALDT